MLSNLLAGCIPISKREKPFDLDSVIQCLFHCPTLMQNILNTKSYDHDDNVVRKFIFLLKQYYLHIINESDNEISTLPEYNELASLILQRKPEVDVSAECRTENTVSQLISFLLETVYSNICNDASKPFTILSLPVPRSIMTIIITVINIQLHADYNAYNTGQQYPLIIDVYIRQTTGNKHIPSDIKQLILKYINKAFKPIKYMFELPSDSTIIDIEMQLEKLTNIPREKYVLCQHHKARPLNQWGSIYRKIEHIQNTDDEESDYEDHSALIGEVGCYDIICYIHPSDTEMEAEFERQQRNEADRQRKEEQELQSKLQESQLISWGGNGEIGRICAALARYYHSLGVVYDKIFSTFCEDYGIDNDALNDELDGSVAECILIEFDENFPFAKEPKTDVQKQQFIFDVIKKSRDKFNLKKTKNKYFQNAKEFVQQTVFHRASESKDSFHSDFGIGFLIKVPQGIDVSVTYVIETIHAMIKPHIYEYDYNENELPYELFIDHRMHYRFPWADCKYKKSEGCEGCELNEYAKEYDTICFKECDLRCFRIQWKTGYEKIFDHDSFKNPINDISVSGQYESLEKLSVFQKQKDITIYDCLDLFIEEQKEAFQTEMRMDKFIKLPEVLVIKLKKFVKNSKFKYKYRNNELVVSPLNGLDLKTYVVENDEKEKFEYNLFATLVHSAGYESRNGYNAYCKNFNDNKWYKCDAETVKELDMDEELDVKKITKYADVLFYVKT
eukprot:378794_1